MQRIFSQLAHVAALPLVLTLSVGQASAANADPATAASANHATTIAPIVGVDDQPSSDQPRTGMPDGHREFIAKDTVDAARAYIQAEQLVPFTTPSGTLTSNGRRVVGHFWVGEDSHRMHYVLANLVIESYYNQYVVSLEEALSQAQEERDEMQRRANRQRDELHAVAIQRDALQQQLSQLQRESSQRIAALEHALEASEAGASGSAPTGAVALGPSTHHGSKNGASRPTGATAPGHANKPGQNSDAEPSSPGEPDQPGDPEGPGEVGQPENPGDTGQAASQTFVAPPDTRPIVVFNMFNGDNAPGDEFEYGRHNNVTSYYKNVEGVEKLKADIIEAAELGFRRMMLHTVIGGKSGYFISGNGRWAIPPQKWDALGKMIEELTEMYPDIEIGPHFACLYTENLESAWGPKAGMTDEYYEQFPRLVGESEAERAFWAETRDAWRNVGATWMSGDNWLSARTRERAVQVIQEEWNQRQFRIIGEAIPVNTQTYEPAAAQVDAWVLSQTMVQRTALVGSNYPQSIAAVPEEVRGHWYVYHWINQWPKIPGAQDDPDAIAILAQKGWVVMHHDPETLAEGYQQAGISVETGEQYITSPGGEGSQTVNEPVNW